MKKQQLILGLLGLLVAGTLVAAPKTPVVVTKNGQAMRVKSVKAMGDGSIEFVDMKGTTIRWKQSQFQYAYVPEPDGVKALESALAKEQYDQVLKFCPQARQQFGILGWGDKLCYLEGMAYLGKNEPAKAAEVFALGMRYPGRSYRDDLARGQVTAMIALGKVEEVKDSLDAMVRSTRDADAAMALNARGEILAKQGKSKEAVLEYLKTLLLFEDGKSVKPYRDEARKQVVALMRKMGDPKWKLFVDIK